MNLYQPTVSGSLVISGSLTVNGQAINTSPASAFPLIQDEIQYINNSSMYAFANNSSIYSRELRFPNLTTVTTDLRFGYVNMQCELIDLPNLTSIGNDLYLDNSGAGTISASLNIPNLTSVLVMYIANLGVTTLNFPLLTTVNRIGLGNLQLATTVNFSAVTSLSVGMYATGLPVLTTINLDSLTSVNKIAMDDLPSLTALNLPSLTTVTPGGFLSVYNCPSLTTLNLSALTTIDSSASYEFDRNALNETSVNAILVKFATISPTGTGTIDLSDGTNAAPTGAGATAKTTLESGGWTVTTN